MNRSRWSTSNSSKPEEMAEDEQLETNSLVKGITESKEAISSLTKALLPGMIEGIREAEEARERTQQSARSYFGGRTEPNWTESSQCSRTWLPCGNTAAYLSS